MYTPVRAGSNDATKSDVRPEIAEVAEEKSPRSMRSEQRGSLVVWLEAHKAGAILILLFIAAMTAYYHLVQRRVLHRAAPAAAVWLELVGHACAAAAVAALHRTVRGDPGLVRNLPARLIGPNALPCPVCAQLRPHGSHHCSVCDACIAEYDHHCAWLGVCIGRGNRRSFVALLGFGAGALMIERYSAVTCALYTSHGAIDTFLAGGEHARTWLGRLADPSTLAWAVMFGAPFVMAMVGLLGLGGLFLYHATLIATGRTSTERALDATRRARRAAASEPRGAVELPVPAETEPLVHTEAWA